MPPKWSILIVLGSSLTSIFSMFHNSQKTHFATCIMRKPLFYNFRHPILASKINQQIVFLPTRFLDLMFLICFRFVSKTVDLGTPFKIQWAPKWDPQSTVFCKLSKRCMKRSAGGGFYSRPAFPETKLTTVPFGPSGF